MAGYTPTTTPTQVTDPTRTAAGGIFTFTDPGQVPTFEDSEQRRQRLLAESEAYGLQAGRLIGGAETDVEALREYSRQLLTGQIPADVSEAVRKASVAAGMQRGVARGQMGRALTARDLGLTSMQLREQGAARAAEAAQLGLSQAEFAQRQREFGISTAEEARRFDVTTTVGASQFAASLTADQRKYFADLSNNINQFNITTAEGIRQFTESMSAEESRFARQLLENARQFDTQTELQDSQFYAQLDQNEQQFVRQLFQNQDQFEKELAQRQREFEVTSAFEATRLQISQQEVDIRAAALVEEKRQFDATYTLEQAKFDVQKEQFEKQFEEQKNQFLAQLGLSRDELNLRAQEVQKKYELEGRRLTMDEALAEAEIEARAAAIRQQDRSLDLQEARDVAEQQYRQDELAQRRTLFDLEWENKNAQFAEQMSLSRDQFNQSVDEAEKNFLLATRAADLSEAQFEQARKEFDTKIGLAINEQIIQLNNFASELQYKYAATEMRGNGTLAGTMGTGQPGEEGYVAPSGPLGQIYGLIQNLTQQYGDITRNRLAEEGWTQDSSGNWTWQDPDTTDTQWRFNTGSSSWEYTSPDDPDWTFVSSTGEWRWSGGDTGGGEAAPEEPAPVGEGWTEEGGNMYWDDDPNDGFRFSQASGSWEYTDPNDPTWVYIVSQDEWVQRT